MEVLKDIFVSYEIAVQLKEIGFDEPCIAVYSKGKLNIFDPNGNIQWVMFEEDFFAPTYEQVKKWFRDEGLVGYLSYFENSDTWVFHIKNDNGLKETSDLKYDTYEQAREALILKLIEIYKNGKQSI